MSDTAFQIENNEKDLRFKLEVNGEVAYLSYNFYKRDLALIHTSVPTALSGKGVGSALAKEAFEYAKRLKMMVIVFCPFVAGFLKKHTEYRIMLDPAYTGR